MNHVTVYVVDAGGNRASMTMPFGAAEAEVDTFFSDWSNAGVERGVSVEEQSITPTAPLAGSNVDRAVKCLFTYGTQKEQFTLLSPKEIGEVKYREGRVLTSAEKTLLLGDWKTANTESVAWILRRNRFLQHK